MDDARIRAFILESLELWQVRASVDSADPPCVAVIRGDDGRTVWLERAHADSPFRWLARWHAGEASGQARTRPCGSLVGVLSALRMALGVDRGSPVRIAPAPEDA
ncbi:MAG: hypothetical protein IT531_17835 [Burkholderiales bacterium]|nr:hypothetical protein [Burkholderiales bacterium]